MSAEARLPDPWRHPVFHEMRARIDTLEEENRQLRALLAPATTFPAAWRLAPQEKQILAALYAREGIVSLSRLCAAVPTHEFCDASTRQIYVVLFRLRRRVRRCGITITSFRGEGYALTAESRSVIGEALAAAAAERC